LSCAGLILQPVGYDPATGTFNGLVEGQPPGNIVRLSIHGIIVLNIKWGMKATDADLSSSTSEPEVVSTNEVT